MHIEGGIGKNILATAVVSSLKDSDPERKIIIVTAWPQVWFNNPTIDRVYVIGQTANFYKDFIYKKDVKIFRQEPYHTEDYILRKNHLIESWCNLIGVKWNNTSPKLYFSPLELEYLKIKMFSNVEKPIFILHANGGGQTNRPYSWYRDIPYQTSKEIIDYYKNDYHIYQLGYDGQNFVEGAHKLTLDTREILGSIIFSKKRLLIDSFSQHASVALGIKSVVCWIGNDSNVLGYNTNTNIVSSVKPVYDTLHSSYLDDYDIGGNPVQYPYDTLNLFNTNDIINALNNL